MCCYSSLFGETYHENSVQSGISTFEGDKTQMPFIICCQCGNMKKGKNSRTGRVCEIVTNSESHNEDSECNEFDYILWTEFDLCFLF
jgi:hypothetical protein